MPETRPFAAASASRLWITNRAAMRAPLSNPGRWRATNMTPNQVDAAMVRPARMFSSVRMRASYRFDLILQSHLLMAPLPPFGHAIAEDDRPVHQRREERVRDPRP